jgi:hypothetical protein
LINKEDIIQTKKSKFKNDKNDKIIKNNIFKIENKNYNKNIENKLKYLD